MAARTLDKNFTAVIFDSTSFAKNNAKYQNLNLNESFDTSKINSVQSKSISLEGQSKASDFIGGGSLKSKPKNDEFAWNKFGSQKQLEFLSHHDCHQEMQKCSKNRNDLNDNKSSTLSLHISAYENNAIEIEQESVNTGLSKKKKSCNKTWKNVRQYLDKSVLIHSFEIPRQQQQENQNNNEPEVMQFKASQKLFDSNSVGKSHKMISQQYEDESVNLLEKTGRACDRLRMELKRCIKESECIQIDRRPAAECIKAHDGRVPDRCFVLLSSFADCKRSMVDMRSRFRGRKGDL